MLKSKIHRACVTDCNIDYEGSITIDRKLMQEADILSYERVEVLNVNNGARLSTYAIEGEQGEICLNGAAARQAVKGDLVIILTYSYIDEQDVRSHSPKMIHVNEKNAVTEIKRGLVFKPSEYFN